MANQPGGNVLGAVGDPAQYTSNNFGAWGKYFSGPGPALAPVVTANAGTAPDGTQTAARVVLNRGTTDTGSSGAYSMLRAVSIPGTNGKVYCDSIYLRTAPGASDVRVDIRSALQGVTETNKVVLVSSAWKRFSVVSPSIVNGQQDFDLLLWDAAHLTPKTDLTADLLVWGFRVDEGSVPLGTDYTAARRRVSPVALMGVGIAALMLFGDGRRR